MANIIPERYSRPNQMTHMQFDQFWASIQYLVIPAYSGQNLQLLLTCAMSNYFENMSASRRYWLQPFQTTLNSFMSKPTAIQSSVCCVDLFEYFSIIKPLKTMWSRFFRSMLNLKQKSTLENCGEDVKEQGKKRHLTYSILPKWLFPTVVFR